jgi:soluble lytic murein transglycosylase-like protein
MASLRPGRVGRMSALVTFVSLLAVCGPVSAQQSAAKSSEVFYNFGRSLDAAADAQLAAVQAEHNIRGNSVSGAKSSAKPESGLDRSGRDGSDFLRSTRAPRFESRGVDARRIFDEAGVPPELLAVARVESHFNPVALSRKGAFGVWQFMPATARRYGLRVDGERDERADTEKSTRAAARYLRDLHFEFQDWLLALAAYNAGEALVQKAVARAGTTDFWSLSSRGYFPEETRNYVPAVLAAMNVNVSTPHTKPRMGRDRVRGEIVFASFVEAAPTKENRFAMLNSGGVEGR